MDCCICDTEAKLILEYSGALGKRIREARCSACAKAVRKNSKNTVYEEIVIDSDGNPKRNASPTTATKHSNKKPNPPHLLTGGNQSSRESSRESSQKERKRTRNKGRKRPPFPGFHR